MCRRPQDLSTHRQSICRQRQQNFVYTSPEHLWISSTQTTNVLCRACRDIGLRANRLHRPHRLQICTNDSHGRLAYVSVQAGWTRKPWPWGGWATANDHKHMACWSSPRNPVQHAHFETKRNLITDCIIGESMVVLVCELSRRMDLVSELIEANKIRRTSSPRSPTPSRRANVRVR